MSGPHGPMGPGGPVLGGEPACVVCQRTWKQDGAHRAGHGSMRPRPAELLLKCMSSHKGHDALDLRFICERHRLANDRDVKDARACLRVARELARKAAAVAVMAQMSLTPSRGDAVRAIAVTEEAENGLAGPQPAPSRQPSAEADEGDAR
jgi:hypothetical protein